MMRGVVWEVLAKSEQALPVDIVVIVTPKLGLFKDGLFFQRRYEFILILMIGEASERVCPRPPVRKGR